MSQKGYINSHGFTSRNFFRFGILAKLPRLAELSQKTQKIHVPPIGPYFEKIDRKKHCSLLSLLRNIIRFTYTTIHV